MGGFATIIAEQRDGVLRLTLNRPAVRNAMSLEMVGELRAALRAAEAGGSVRVIVLRGAGGTFCSGGDISDMAKARGAEPQGGSDPIAEVSRAFGELCAAFSRTGLAVVAVVEGAAMGGGFGLACVSDVTIAAPGAKFGLPETGLGLVPAQIVPLLMERLGAGQTRRLAVIGGFVGAEEALAIGLAHEVAKDVDAALEATLARILACAPEALAATKALIRQARLEPAEALVGHAAEVFAAAVRGAEGIEGMKAFLEKRKAAWVLPSPRSRGEGARRADEGPDPTSGENQV